MNISSGATHGRFRGKQCNKKEMAFMNVLSSITLPEDTAVSYKSEKSIDDQYDQFLQFIEATHEPLKSQLELLVYPLFVHLYLDLAVHEFEKEATEFFAKYSGKFLGSSQDRRDFVSKLSCITCLDDLKAYPDANLFMESRYVVKISLDCLIHLKCYLDEFDPKTLMYFFNFSFSFECVDSDLDCNESTSDDSDEIPHLERQVNTRAVPKEQATAPQLLREQSETDLIDDLMQAIEDVETAPFPPPAIGLFNINTGSYGFSSASISPNHSLLAIGFEQSRISLQHVAHLPSGRKTHFKDSDHLLVGHSGPVHGLCFTAKENYFYSCSSDTTVRCWKVDSRKTVAHYPAHRYPVWDVDVIFNGSCFATCSKDTTARLWSSDRLYPLKIFVGHTADVNCIKFHPNCNYLVSGSSDNTARLWDVQAGHCARLFTGHQGPIMCTEISPNGQLLATAGEDGKIKIWDIGKGQLLKDLSGEGGPILSICFASNGKYLVSCSNQKLIRLWDLHNIKNDTVMGVNNIPVPVEHHKIRSSPRRVSCNSMANVVMVLGIDGGQ